MCQGCEAHDGLGRNLCTWRSRLASSSTRLKLHPPHHTQSSHANPTTQDEKAKDPIHQRHTHTHCQRLSGHSEHEAQVSRCTCGHEAALSEDVVDTNMSYVGRVRHRMLLRWLQFQHGNHPLLSWTTIQTHSHRDDCWLVVENVVLDVTRFISRHPAGEKTITRYGGQDATVHYNFHSEKAKKLWKESNVVGFVLSPPPQPPNPA